MSEREPPEEVKRHFDNPGLRFTYLTIANYLLHALDGRRTSLERTLREVNKCFDDQGQLSPDKSLLWVHAVADSMMLFSDLGAIVRGLRGPTNELGLRMARITSGQVRSIFQEIRDGTALADAKRIWNMDGLAERCDANETLTAEEKATIQRGVESTLQATAPSLLAISRIYLRHEELLHQVKHSPWRIVSNLQNLDDGRQVIAAIINDELWSRSGDGVLLLPVSRQMWNVWANGVEEAHLLVQVALNNVRFRIELRDDMVPPVTVCSPDEDLKRSFIRVCERLVSGHTRTQINVQMNVTGKLVEGGWLDDQEHLWERLRSADFSPAG